jgi:uncharacterized protein YdaU (DUF1376 family)
MAEFPAMPLFTDAYLADCDHLTDCEHGRYLLMLIHMWRAPGRRFPNDDAWLARKFRRTVEQVRAELRPLLEEFFATTGNWLFHKRLEREFAHLTRTSRKQSDRAKSRWEKEKGACRGNAPTPTPPKKEEEGESPLRSPPMAVDAPPDKPASPQPRSAPPPVQPEIRLEVEPEKPPEKPPRAKRRSEGTRLPEGWQPSADEVAFAERVGLNHDEIIWESDKFRCHFVGAVGQRARKADWHVTWQNWIRRAIDHRGRSATRPGAGSGNGGSYRGTGRSTSVMDGSAEVLRKRRAMAGQDCRH